MSISMLHWRIPGIPMPTRIDYLLKLAVVAGAYFLAGKIGLAVPFTSHNVSPVWPPAGIAVAAALLWGYRVWPGIALGAFVVNFFSAAPHAAAPGIAIGSTCSALLTAWIVRRIPGSQISLTHLPEVLGLTGAAAASTTVAAAVGVASLHLAGARPWSTFGSAWLIWWLGDFMGVLLVAPLLLTAPRLAEIRRPGRWLELAAVTAASIAVAVLTFDGSIRVGRADNVLAFVVFPFVMWAAIRFAVAGAAVVSLAIAGVAVWETSMGLGPFALPNPVRGATLLQFFLAVMSASGLILAAVISEREQAQSALFRISELARQRQLAQQALRSSERRMSGIVNSAMDAILTVDESQKVIVFNAAAERIFRCPAQHALGRTLDRFIPHRFRQAHQRHIQAFGETGITARSMYSPGTLYGLRGDGEEFPIEATISQVEAEGHKFYTVILRDISLRKQAEDALLRSEKLISAGRLAATIAHEINNPLAAVTNLVYVARQQPGLGGSAAQYLEMADGELKRIAHIVKQTLGFYREEAAPSRFSPAAVVDSVLDLLDRGIRAKHIRVEKTYADGLQVVGIPGEIRQVISNLVSNAVEAMEEGGRLTVRISAASDWRRPWHRGVRVTIVDDGLGIAPQNLSKIFEPFFTTKKDIGTGLGLWVSRQIIEKNGGSICVRSRTRAPRRGTVFALFLPDSPVRPEGVFPLEQPPRDKRPVG